MDLERMPAAWALVGLIYGREVPNIDELVGRVMVERSTYRPVAMAGLYFEPSGIVSVQASFGDYFRQWPTYLLAEVAMIMRIAKDAGVEKLHAIADEGIKGSTDLVEWLGGIPTGDRNELGELYVMDMTNPRISALIEKRGR